MIRYYKSLKDKTVKYFYINDAVDCVEGLIEEVRSNGMLVIHRNLCPQYYMYISCNKTASEMLKRSVEISAEEYNIVDAVSKAMIENDTFIISGDKLKPIEEKEVKLEPIFAD